MFPASTNGDYKGSTFSWQVLLVIAPLLILSGVAHLAGQSVGAAIPATSTGAGRALTHVTAVQGSFEVALAVLYLMVVVRYRSFVPIALLVEGVRQVLNQAVFWFLAPPATSASEEPVLLQMVFVGVTVVVVVAFLLSGPGRGRQGASQPS
jgi:hypothetical protein